jgi:hypothetical protein
LSETDDLEQYDNPAAKIDRVEDADAAAEQRLEHDDSAGFNENDHLTPDEIAQRRLEAGESQERSSAFVEYVDVASLKIDDVDPNFESTPKNTRGEMREFMSDLPQIQKMRAEGSSSDDFARMRESADPAEQRLGKTEDILYSARNHPEQGAGHGIGVEWSEGEWKVEQGKHRVMVAKELGLESVPAVVKAPDNARIDDLRYRR